MKPIEIAKMVHEVNRAYCKALGDTSQLSWEDAPQWQKDSALKGVLFHASNPEYGPENSHESWLAEKNSTGWVYGVEKDEEKKTHPCMVPYNKLPVEQQAKDYIFKAIVDQLEGWRE